MPRLLPLLAPLLVLLPFLLGGCPDVERRAAQSPQARPALITPSPALAEMVCALGAREHLVGVSRYCRFPQELEQVPRIGGMVDPNLEAIAALHPDLVLTQGRHEGVRELAARRGFGVEHFDIETVAQVHAALRRLGVLLEREEAAAREVARLKAAFQRPRPPTWRPPRTLLVLGHRPGELGQISSPGNATFLSECLRAAGGLNCLEGLDPRAWHVVAKEVLLEQAPELIVELQDVPPDAEAAAALRADWRALPGIPAVAQGRIAIVSGSEVYLPSPRLDHVVAKLARAIDGELDPP